MNILISNASPQPLYEQIEEQVRNQILSGALRQGDPMPSIRHLARELILLHAERSVRIAGDRYDFRRSASHVEGRSRR